MDVSCSSCSLSNLLALHSLQLLSISRVLFVQALQTSSKTTAVWLVTCIIGRAKNIGLLGQSLPKLAIIHAVAIRLVICIIRRAKTILSLYHVAWERSLRIYFVNLAMMPCKSPFEKLFPYLFVQALQTLYA